MRKLEPVSTANVPKVADGIDSALPALKAACGGRASVAEQDRVSYSRDMWSKSLLWIREGKIPPPPDVVVWPKDAQEVAAIIRIARERKLAVVPFGAGSGVCGGVVALEGGIALDLKRLESIGKVDPERLCVEVEAGVLGETLERNLAAQGYTLGHFPSSIYMSTLGGWIAARSAGQLSNRYGKIEDMVLSARGVDGTGEFFETAEPGAGSFNLAPLLIGSEGTLCTFTSARLRVHPAPQLRLFRGITFKTVDAGVEAIRRLFHAGLRPAVVRLYDPFDTALVGRNKPHRKPKTPPSLKNPLEADLVPALLRELSPRFLRRPTAFNKVADLMRHCLLILMFEGDSERVTSEEAEARALCLAAGGEDNGEQPGKDWYRKRYDVSYKMSKVLDAGAFADTMEVAATWEKVLEVYEAVRREVSPYAFIMCHFSHAYAEGCSLYFSFVASSPGAQIHQRYDDLWRTALGAAMRAGATVSHHHGIGILKSDALSKELGTGRQLLAALKRAMDPDGIMNPGKLGL